MFVIRFILLIKLYKVFTFVYSIFTFTFTVKWSFRMEAAFIFFALDDLFG